MYSRGAYDSGMVPMSMVGSSPTYNSRSAMTPPSFGNTPPSFTETRTGSFPSPMANHSPFVGNLAPTTVFNPSPTHERSTVFNPSSPYAEDRPQTSRLLRSYTEDPPQTTRLLPTKPVHRECDDECAEEECLDPDQCGAENRPPKPENLTCGVDTRPLLPIALAVSTVVGALTMMLIQLPLLCRLLDISMSMVSIAALTIYGVTLGCMTYCAFSDPGQLRKEHAGGNYRGEGMSPNGTPEPGLPKRAHKSWQYRRAIRRYDHYCRWLSNCIGLLNHREFFMMLIGLVTIGVLGTAIDVLLAVSMMQKAFWIDEILVVLHLVYSLGLLALAGPILRIHAGLVSRNEVAAEWKRNDFYVAVRCKKGENVSVNELSDDEFNHLFDSFVYDKRKNALDRGFLKNCFAFWCSPRWSADQQGDF